jgi:hypothetical protein
MAIKQLKDGSGNNFYPYTQIEAIVDASDSILPSVTSSDNGKILQVVEGEWAVVSPLTLYSGTGEPDNSQGNNGDIYLQI